MKAKNRRVMVYIILNTLSVAIAILGLNIKIKTDIINNTVHQMKKEVGILKEENRKLQLKILEKNHLAALEKHARDTLKMAPPKKVIYIPLHPEERP